MTSWAKAAAILTAIAVCTAAVNADAGSVYRRTDDQKRIALTFDDGPHPRSTPQILDLLDEFGVAATFFVIGKNAADHPELVRREIGSGHEIGNHTWSHGSVRGLSEEELTRELISAEKAVSACGYVPRLFRPPGGCYDDATVDTASRLGYSVVLWSVDTRDWSGVSARQIVNTVRDGVCGGCIILCHDFVSGGGHTVEALRILIPELLADGYEFVTVSELIGKGQ